MTDVYERASTFPTEEYTTLEEAREAEMWALTVMDLPNVPAIEDTLEYSCNPRRFRKVDGDQWQDRTTQEIYNIESADQICPDDGSVKLRLALHLAEPQHFVAILCPSILGQTDDQPKMYATLEGVELSDTRPDGDPPLDVLIYLGMSIDDLRARVLSVYLGRVILFIEGAKWPDVAPSKTATSAGNHT